MGVVPATGSFTRDVTRGITNLGESGVGPTHHSVRRVNRGDRLIAVGTRSVRWVGVAIDCADAGPVARFYEQLLGFRIGDFDPPRWAPLWDTDGGVLLDPAGHPLCLFVRGE